MAVSRPVLLALLGSVLLVATFMATRSVSTDGNATAPSTAPSKQTQAKPATNDSKPQPAKHKAKQKQPAPAVKAARPNTGSSNGLPLDVAKAMAKRDTLVLLFSQTGADDAATRSSVRALRGERKVAVFIEDLKHLSDYRRIVSGLNITEAPSVVLVGPDRQARLVEGFVDEGSLRQHVRDVR